MKPKIEEIKNIMNEIEPAFKEKILKDTIEIKKWTRICPKCSNTVFHKSRASRNLSRWQNSVCRLCKYASQRRKTPYDRKCPNCGILIHYGFASGYWCAIKNNSKCNSCSKFGIKPHKTVKSKFNRKCPTCFSKIYYKEKWGRDSANKQHTICRECRANEQRKRMASTVIQQFHCPAYNSKACQIFEQINKEFGWNGQHAENGGEFEVLGYFVDYYEPNLNIVIEYDEPHHTQTRHIKRDKKKQLAITENLGCKFYRIQEGENWHLIDWSKI